MDSGSRVAGFSLAPLPFRLALSFRGRLARSKSSPAMMGSKSSWANMFGALIDRPSVPARASITDSKREDTSSKSNGRSLDRSDYLGIFQRSYKQSMVNGGYRLTLNNWGQDFKFHSSPGWMVGTSLAPKFT